jgi:hypothetical protein
MPNFLNTPLTTAPRRLADYIAEEIDNQNKADNGGDRGVVKPFIAGSIQGLGDTITDFTSPMGIGMLALTGPAMRGLSGLRGLSSIGRMAKQGRNLSRWDKMFNVVDDAGRELLNPGGYAGPRVTGKPMTQGTQEAVSRLEQLRTPLKTKVQPPRTPKVRNYAAAED